MNPSRQPFFSIAELRQPVNQWLCIAFVGLWFFWIMLYYFTQKAQIIGESYSKMNVVEVIKADN